MQLLQFLEEELQITGGNGQIFLNTVEAYDNFSNTWSSLPSMVEERLCHSSVAISNQLYVIENISTTKNNFCEVFGSVCNRFDVLKTIPKLLTDELFSIETYRFQQEANL